jgi:hypothetical protein
MLSWTRALASGWQASRVNRGQCYCQLATVRGAVLTAGTSSRGRPSADSDPILRDPFGGVI